MAKRTLDCQEVKIYNLSEVCQLHGLKFVHMLQVVFKNVRNDYVYLSYNELRLFRCKLPVHERDRYMHFLDDVKFVENGQPALFALK